MKTLLRSITVVAAALSAASAQPLSQAFTTAEQTAKPSSQALQRSVAAHAAEAKARARAREFNLEFTGRWWRLVPNPNPPGSSLLISVDQGERVKINVSYLPFRDAGGVNFDVDSLDAVVDGKPSHGVHLWLNRGDQAVVEFDAVKPGIYLMRNPWGGRIVVLGRKTRQG